MADYDKHNPPVTEDMDRRLVGAVLNSYASLIYMVRDLDVLKLATILHEASGYAGDVSGSPVWSHPLVAALLKIFENSDDMSLIDEAVAKLWHELVCPTCGGLYIGLGRNDEPITHGLCGENCEFKLVIPTKPDPIAGEA